MVHPGGFEPPTARFVAEYSIQLSYGCKMAVRRGFEPRMQLLTAYSLSRGAPSASRPPHHTPLASASKNLFKLIVAAWRTYYFLGLISQWLFLTVLFVCTLHAQSDGKNDKKSELSTETVRQTGCGKARAQKEKVDSDDAGVTRRGKMSAPHPKTRRMNISNWTAGIFQPEYAGRSLHDGQRLL